MIVGVAHDRVPDTPAAEPIRSHPASDLGGEEPGGFSGRWLPFTADGASSSSTRSLRRDAGHVEVEAPVVVVHVGRRRCGPADRPTRRRSGPGGDGLELPGGADLGADRAVVVEVPGDDVVVGPDVADAEQVERGGLGLLRRSPCTRTRSGSRSAHHVDGAVGQPLAVGAVRRRSRLFMNVVGAEAEVGQVMEAGPVVVVRHVDLGQGGLSEDLDGTAAGRGVGHVVQDDALAVASFPAQLPASAVLEGLVDLVATRAVEVGGGVAATFRAIGTAAPSRTTANPVASERRRRRSGKVMLMRSPPSGRQPVQRRGRSPERG